MTKVYAHTPAASRVHEGKFGEAILPPAGIQPGPVYVYDAAVRAWHWVTALCIFVLAVTGYFIGSPRRAWAARPTSTSCSATSGWRTSSPGSCSA